MERVHHPFSPVFDRNSKILILGSLPSVKSRAVGFYYGHPQNRFWRILSAVYGVNIPLAIEGKTSFLLKQNIALWDIIQSSEIKGSSDSSIKNAIPNDIESILKSAPIQKIITNGSTAHSFLEKFYGKNISEKWSIKIEKCPSTSAANAARSFERLLDFWKRSLLNL